MDTAATGATPSFWVRMAPDDSGRDRGSGAPIMASATPCVSLCKANALTHLSTRACEDCDIMRSACKWPMW